jgi:Tol biopolymer transport system component
MKKWMVCLVFILGLSLLCSCQKKDPVVIDTALKTPIYSKLTYSFVPNNSGAHMFDICEVDQDGSGHQVLLKATMVGFNQPDWTGDGTTMAIWGWHSPRTISIYTYNTQTEVLTRLTDQKNVYDMFPHWNASGDKIVFTRQYLLEDDRNEIWTINADGSDARKIVDGYTGSWSPDGKQIVYSHVIDGNEDLYTCLSDGTQIEKLLDSPRNETFPMWSPDGQLVMFGQFLSSKGVKDVNSYEICVLNVQTGEVKALTQNQYLDSSARWSLDGTQIAFLSQAKGPEDYEIYVMNADGTGVKQVTTTKEGSFATFPSWRPVSAENKIAEPTKAEPYTRTEKQLGSGRSFDLCHGDFNGDGLLDVFVTTYEGESGLYFKTSQGYALSPDQFSTAVENGHGIASGDLDNDGDLDLFLVNNSAYSRVYFNDGTGHFVMSKETYGREDGRGLNVTLADADGDRDLDAYVSYYQRPAELLLNDGRGYFETTSFDAFKSETVQLLVTDFNQDGAMDIYFVNQNRQDQIALNDGKGIMTVMPELYSESVSWGNASTGDLNGDGYPDVVVTNEEQGASIWLNDMSGKLLKHGESFGGSNTNVLLEDLDQDGDIDMVIMDLEKKVEIYHNDGLANFALYKTLENSYNAVTAFVMDFDDDGHLDILIGRMMGGNVIYYYE